MYTSYHEINDAGVYELSELQCFLRYSDIVEFYRADRGDMLTDPTGSYRYRMVGYFTDVSTKDGSCNLVLLVAHEALPLPPFEAVASIV